MVATQWLRTLLAGYGWFDTTPLLFVQNYVCVSGRTLILKREKYFRCRIS